MGGQGGDCTAFIPQKISRCADACKILVFWLSGAIETPRTLSTSFGALLVGSPPGNKRSPDWAQLTPLWSSHPVRRHDSLKADEQSFRGRIAHYARVVHKVCTVPYPNCIVVPSINNGEPRESRVWSPSPPPSPSQPGRSLVASPEAKRRDPPPSQRSNTPSTSVSQPRAASWSVRSPSASTASSPYLLAQRTSHSRLASGSGHSRTRGGSPSHSTSEPRPKRARAPKTTAHSGQNEKERNTIVRPICPSMHWKVIGDIWMGSAHDCGLG